MTPDDKRDLAIHYDIERMIQVFTLRGLTRAQVFEKLCNGEGQFNHGLNAIAELHSITRHEVNERVSAFIEAEKEEEAERISRLIENALSREDAA